MPKILDMVHDLWHPCDMTFDLSISFFSLPLCYSKHTHAGPFPRRHQCADVKANTTVQFPAVAEKAFLVFSRSPSCPGPSDLTCRMAT